MNIYSSSSRNQEASFHAIDSFNTVWVVDSFDPNERFERQGEPVRAGEPILLRHCHTQQYLASDVVVEKNDFGTEYEVSTHSFHCPNKTQNLELEKKGAITTDVPTRYHQDQNVWMFETAPNPGYMQDIETLQKFNVSEVLNDIANFLKEKSSIEALKKVFTTIDEKGEKHVDAEDFRWGMIDLGYNLSKREADEIILYYDDTGMNVLFYETFIESLQ